MGVCVCATFVRISASLLFSAGLGGTAEEAGEVGEAASTVFTLLVVGSSGFATTSSTLFSGTPVESLFDFFTRITGVADIGRASDSKCALFVRLLDAGRLFWVSLLAATPGSSGGSGCNTPLSA